MQYRMWYCVVPLFDSLLQHIVEIVRVRRLISDALAAPALMATPRLSAAAPSFAPGAAQPDLDPEQARVLLQVCPCRANVLRASCRILFNARRLFIFP